MLIHGGQTRQTFGCALYQDINPISYCKKVKGKDYPNCPTGPLRLVASLPAGGLYL